MKTRTVRLYAAFLLTAALGGLGTKIWYVYQEYPDDQVVASESTDVFLLYYIFWPLEICMLVYFVGVLCTRTARDFVEYMLIVLYILFVVFILSIIGFSILWLTFYDSEDDACEKHRNFCNVERVIFMTVLVYCVFMMTIGCFPPFKDVDEEIVNYEIAVFLSKFVCCKRNNQQFRPVTENVPEPSDVELG